MGIKGLTAIVKEHVKYAADHQMAVIDCLEDPDETLKRKTVCSREDPIYLMHVVGFVVPHDEFSECGIHCGQIIVISCHSHR